MGLIVAELVALWLVNKGSNIEGKVAIFLPFLNSDLSSLIEPEKGV
jgi:hypothetical protein